MQVIILGCGKVGQALAAELIRQEEDVVVVDADAKALEQIEHLDCEKVHGISIDQEVLRDAGIETADLVCAVMPDDNLNLTATQIAKSIFGVKRVITRLYNPTKIDLYREFGLDVFNPTALTVNEIMRQIRDEQTSYEHVFYNSHLSYVLVPIEEELIGEKLDELVSLGEQYLIGLVRNDHFYLKQDDLILEPNDRLVFLKRE